MLQQPELVKKLLLDHVVLGERIDVTNLTSPRTFRTLSGREVRVTRGKEDKLLANEASVLAAKVAVPNGILIVVDNYLFPEDHVNQSKNGSIAQKIDVGVLSVASVKEEAKTLPVNMSFIENIMQVLSFLKSGVRVFQHFLARSNVSHLLVEGIVDDRFYAQICTVSHSRWFLQINYL